MHTMQKLWEQIDTWFRANALSVWDPSSSEGASEEQIEQAEAAMGVILSDDFKASYRIHNGGCPFPPWQEGLMTLSDIVGTWQMFKEHLDQGYGDDFPDEPPGPVQPFHWHPMWIPLAWGGYGGEYACLDLNPAPGGQIGQVILRPHESEPARLINPSFGNWLATFANDLKTGKYIVNERELERKTPLKQRAKQGFAQVLQHMKHRFQRYIRIFLLFRQNPKQAYSLIMISLVKPAARDFWLRLRSGPRTRWVRVVQDTPYTAAWSPDGTYLISGLTSQVQLWNARRGELLRTFPAATSSGSIVAWSPDGKHLLLMDTLRSLQRIQALDGTSVRAYTLPDQNAPASPQSYDPIVSIAWSPHGERIAAGMWQGKVHIWDAQTGVLLTTHSRSIGRVSALAWSPDGACLVTMGIENKVQAWSTDGNVQLWTFPGQMAAQHTIQSFAWSPESKRLAISDWTKVHIIDATNGHVISTYDYPHVRSLAWSPDGRFIALGDSIDGLIQVIKALDGHRVTTYYRHMLHRSWLFPSKDARTINTLAWSPDGCTIVSGGRERSSAPGKSSASQRPCNPRTATSGFDRRSARAPSLFTARIAFSH